MFVAVSRLVNAFVIFHCGVIVADRLRVKPACP